MCGEVEKILSSYYDAVYGKALSDKKTWELEEEIRQLKTESNKMDLDLDKLTVLLVAVASKDRNIAQIKALKDCVKDISLRQAKELIEKVNRVVEENLEDDKIPF